MSSSDREPPAGAMLRGVDRAAFAVGLTLRLRAAGVDVDLPSAGTFARALAAQPPSTRSELYWLARISLTHRHGDLDSFDRVFTAAFDGMGLEADPHSRRSSDASPPPNSDDKFAPLPRGRDDIQDGGGLPWATLPPIIGASEDTESSLNVPERLPSNLVGLAETPFE